MIGDNKKRSRTKPERAIAREYEQKLLDVARVVRVVAGGRRFRFRAVMVVGDKKSKVGVGVSKGQDVSTAVEKAVADARKNMISVPITEGTIPHQVEAKFSTARVILKPAAKGRGIVAGGAVRVVCDLAGIDNLSGKIVGKTRNKLNNARATLKALKKLRPAKDKKEIKKHAVKRTKA